MGSLSLGTIFFFFDFFICKSQMNILQEKMGRLNIILLNPEHN